MIYGIKPNGDLIWYQFLGLDTDILWANDGEGIRVGTGWNQFTTVVSAGFGVIYGVEPNGDLMWYHHDGWFNGDPKWANGGIGKRVGTGWNQFAAVISGGFTGHGAEAPGAILYGIEPNGDLMWYRHDDPMSGVDIWFDPHDRGTKVGIEWDEFVPTLRLGVGELLSFENVNSHLCIGVSGASMSPGGFIQQFACDGRVNQKWSTRGEVVITGFHPIGNVNSGLCMGVDNGSPDPGAAIRQFACDSRVNQQWSPIVGPDSTFSFQNSDGLCIGVDGASTSPGAQLRQFRCDGRPNQRWIKRNG